MFGELLESRAKRARNRGAMIASLVGHGVFITLAVLATRTQLTARVPDERVVPLPVLPPDPPRHPPVPAPALPLRSPGRPVIGPVIVPPLVIPDVILPVDPQVEIPLPDPTDWEWGPRVRGDTSSRASTSTPGVDDAIPFASGVDKPAMALPGNPAPHYPEVLRRTGVHGEVTVEVVVDTTGRAQMESLRIVASDHPLMTEAVRSALARARFLPAETGGRRVRMWIRQTFVFEMR